METNNKKASLNENRELADEVLDIYSLKVFIILDLFLFSIFFGLLLHPLLPSLWLTFLLPLLFFTTFTALLQLLDILQKKSRHHF
ncbi:hypothetical protein QUF81_14075 [Peribacillus simplex]|jgi:hypothetical protein|uniref:YrhK domain-containing protein n=1 Tax=Peribacillus simplex TaxID=1478 RepID=A0AAW7IFP4_9BACI|nr:hypothetical protein [Peribacillus simplex]SNT43851.1 hypothetical protein SAMN05444672_12375 [Bacillus sp. OK838]AMM93512.1 hypothetical protein UP17_14380 [Peribacillus simplex]MDF9760966.1 hypothetical protein [Peribacillus simplex]MDM5294301.1 hypothetical protein [Peribacillus simplex]MDM5453254.1 hypothetical protein [Peribacillus simplex]